MSGNLHRARSPWLFVAVLFALAAASTGCGKEEEDGGYSEPTGPEAVATCDADTTDCAALRR